MMRRRLPQEAVHPRGNSIEVLFPGWQHARVHQQTSEMVLGLTARQLVEELVAKGLRIASHRDQELRWPTSS
ncbi:hypothetical protein ACWGCW_32220 [Streptomyces sp. NPDC054933]